tara:strand:- start:4204 stop:4944 length:741 start_codon:yes stop_codon:yes gene_type:complete
MKTVVCAGDSFTFHCIDEYLAWPYHLDKAFFDVHVCAEMGSSNTMIARNALYELSKHRGKEDVVLVVGWSEPSRFEVHYTDEHPMFSSVKTVEKTHDHKVTNFLRDGDTSESAWLKSTGGYGHWTFGNEFVDHVVETYFGYYHCDVNQYIDSMQAVLLLQNYCIANKIPMLNFKAWDNTMLDAGVDEAKHLEDIVDRSLWWFHNGNQGLREWCRDRGDDIPEGMHPHGKYQHQFASEIITPFLKGT